MKKLFALLLVMAMIFSVVAVMTACGGKNNNPSNPATEEQNPNSDNNQANVGDKPENGNDGETEEEDEDWSSSTDTEWSDVTVLPTNPGTEPPTGEEPTTNLGTEAPDNGSSDEYWNEDEWSSESDVEWYD